MGLVAITAGTVVCMASPWVELSGGMQVWLKASTGSFRAENQGAPVLAEDFFWDCCGGGLLWRISVPTKGTHWEW